MSSHRLYREHQSRERLDYILGQLDLELRLHTPRRLLLPLLELCDLHLERAGGNYATTSLRERVGAMRARVTAAPHLHLSVVQ